MSLVTAAPPTEVAVHREGARRMGFFTDTTVCIGCKSCEVACKQWNDLPADGSVFGKGTSYDHTGELGANTWRHVRFVELLEPSPALREEAAAALARGNGGRAPSLPSTGMTSSETLNLVDVAANGGRAGVPDELGDWVFMSDVCKHCTNAGCLDACPTGALIRTEFQTVVLQPDVCNGCGYCVPSCPFGVVDKDHVDGRAAKCTLCYDRLKGGHEPACAKSCPTDSIQFGELGELRERAEKRLEKLRAEKWNGARLYGHDPDDGVGGFGAFFLLLDDPEVYGLPPDPVVPTAHLPRLWKATALAATGMFVGLVAAFVGGRE